MALGPKSAAAVALHRFGLGPRSGSVAAIASDAKGALLAELDRPDAARIANPELPTSSAAARAAIAFQQAQRAARQAARATREGNAQAGGTPEMKPAEQSAPPPAAPAPGAAQGRAAGPPVPQQLYLDDAKARIHAALGADIGFAERL